MSRPQQVPAWLAVLAVLALACGGVSDSTATFTAVPPTSTKVLEAAPTPTQAPTTTPVPTEAASPARGVTGLFQETRPVSVAKTVTLAPLAPSAFEAWDRESVVLYNMEAATATEFGPGFVAGFSDNGRWLGYNTAGMFWAVDLETGAVEGYESTGGIGMLVGDHHALLQSSRGPLLDLETGESLELEDIADSELAFAVEQRLRPTGDVLLDDGLVLRRANWEASCAGSDGDLCRQEAFERWWVEDLDTGDRLLEFRAIAAAPAGPGEIVMATSPLCEAADGSLQWCHDVLEVLRPTLDRSSPTLPYPQGTTNIFLVSIATGEAKFLATATYNPPVFVWPLNWPLIANQSYVVWTESYCGQLQGQTRIFDRATGEIVELELSAWLRWHGEYIGMGDFSSSAIFDPASMALVAEAPPDAGRVVWSPDLRYAATGQVLGHGGLCG